MTSHFGEKRFWINISREVKEESRTDMEAAIFKTFKAADDLGKIIAFDVII